MARLALRPWETGAIFIGIPLGVFLLVTVVVLLTTKPGSNDTDLPVLGSPLADPRGEAPAGTHEHSTGHHEEPDEDAETGPLP